MEKIFSRLDLSLRSVYINELIFLALLALSFLGDLLGELSAGDRLKPRIAIFYWLSMVPIFMLASIFSEKVQLFVEGRNKLPRGYLRFELIFWGSALVAILLVMLLIHAEMISYQAAGMVIHIILAHTMFVTGARQGARFYLIGIFLFITAAMAVIMEGIIGMLLAVTLIFGFLGIYIEEHYVFPVIRRDFENQEE